MDLSTNYFALFGLPADFALDAAALAPAWRELQRQHHPDRHAGGDATAQREAVQMAAHVNTAYETLRDPVRRAHYLLQLAGHGIDGERATIADSDFLMTQMELREQLDEVEHEHELDAVEDEARDWRDSLLREFPLDYAAQDWQEAQDTLRKLQFMERLLAEIGERRDRFEDELDDL